MQVPDLEKIHNIKDGMMSVTEGQSHPPVHL